MELGEDRERDRFGRVGADVEADGAFESSLELRRRVGEIREEADTEEPADTATKAPAKKAAAKKAPAKKTAAKKTTTKKAASKRKAS